MWFVGGVVALNQATPSTGLFTATIRTAADGRVVEERLGRALIAGLFRDEFAAIAIRNSDWRAIQVRSG